MLATSRTLDPMRDTYRSLAVDHSGLDARSICELRVSSRSWNRDPSIHASSPTGSSGIANLGPLLQTAIDPNPVTVGPDAPLEATWRLTESDAWVFVLNTSSSAVTGHLQLGGVTGDASVHAESREVSLAGGTLTDELSPYEVHVYQLSRS